MPFCALGNVADCSLCYPVIHCSSILCCISSLPHKAASYLTGWRSCISKLAAQSLSSVGTPADSMGGRHLCCDARRNASPLWTMVEPDPHPSGWDAVLFVALLFILAVGLFGAVFWWGCGDGLESSKY